jgi:hypothetical protein
MQDSRIEIARRRNTRDVGRVGVEDPAQGWKDLKDGINPIDRWVFSFSSYQLLHYTVISLDMMTWKWHQILVWKLQAASEWLSAHFPRRSILPPIRRKSGGGSLLPSRCLKMGLNGFRLILILGTVGQRPAFGDETWSSYRHRSLSLD